MIPGPIIGTGLHAAGGISASSCYTPFEKMSKWSWLTFWLVQALFAWIVVPLVLAVITVPDYFSILAQTPSDVFWGTFVLGGFYGFGGMSFGFAIKHIGYSLTFAISIGISAVVGTITPLVIDGTLVQYFSQPGGNIVLVGMIISLVGVSVCGLAGFRKEKEGMDANFNMSFGLLLTIIAGVLSGVFNISLEYGQPIADMAAANGAGIYEGNAKLLVSTSGCFVVNFVWFMVLGFKQGKLNELVSTDGIGMKGILKNYGWSALAGLLWTLQFFFYGIGHVYMGDFQYVSWVLHMSMLVFFGYLVGVLMKEWKGVSSKTYNTLIVALLILFVAFVIISYGTTTV